uniref:Glycosyltransferase n=1 Tax=Linum usitatissimum TaxID=4006 RepID=I2BH23_LINUS|nr:UDP-glycosyltransferase 1 [Linum usitatissimum]
MEDVVSTISRKANLRVVMVPSPGRGHLIPFVELSKRLLLRHNFAITILIPDNGSDMIPQRQFLQSLNLPPTISPLYLPPVSLSDLPSDADSITRVPLTVIRSLPAIRDAIINLQHSGEGLCGRVVAVVVDFLGADALQVATQLQIPPYVFYTCSAFHLTLGLNAPQLLHPTHQEDSTKLLKLPGCIPLLGADLPEPYIDKKKDAYKWMVHSHERISSDAVGIIINSFVDLESDIFKALTEERFRTGSGPTVYPIGPLKRLDSDEDLNQFSNESIDCLEWLDKQPESSVLLISFGSGIGARQSKAQFDELAHGLAMSGKRFIWVVKPPGNDVVPWNSSFLPEGFLKKTKGVGLVIPDWVPQIRILSHGSTGGFMSHCGWNSSLESITNGVPVLAWPQHADQKMNAALLVEDAKVALRVDQSSGEDGIVGREEIARYVKAVLDGDEAKLLRKKMRELKVAANNATGNDGSSTKSLDEVANLWKNQNPY